MQQSGKDGIRAIEIAKELKIDRTTVHRHLTSLDLRGKVESKNGRWYATTEEQTNKLSEKEIVIELPMPKREYRQKALLEMQAKEAERVRWPLLAQDIRILLEKSKETRTIKIRGKNVDDLDLEKLSKLIQQANENSLKASLKGLFKSLKRSHGSNSSTA